MNLPLRNRVAGVAIGLLLGACGAEKEPACRPSPENYIADPAFERLEAPRRERAWRPSEHAAGGTFTYAVEAGVLTIRKTGGEPWFLMSQTVPPAALQGKTLVYSAELRLDLHPPAVAHAFKQGGGLVFSAKTGGKTVVESLFEHEPHMGSSDWRPVEVRVQLPPRVDYIRVGILHQADGTLQVRNPRLSIFSCSD